MIKYLLLFLIPLSSFATLIKIGPELFKSAAGDQFLAFTFTNEGEWHTYYKNPGDSGMATKFLMSDDQNSFVDKSSDVLWPVPSRFFERGELQIYGYKESYTFFLPIYDRDLSRLKKESILFKFEYLACFDTCVPEKQEVRLSLKDKSLLQSANQVDLTKRFNELPQVVVNREDVIFNLIKENEKILLETKYIQSSDISFIDALTIPLSHSNILFKKEENSIDEHKNINSKIPLEIISGEALTFPLTLTFLVKAPFKRAQIVTKTFDGIGESSIIDPKAKTLLVEKNVPQNELPLPSSISLLMILFFSFIGGLILNLMPCVLPIISLKLFSLIKIKNESGKNLRLHLFSYIGGILLSFIIMATIVQIFKFVGVTLGWGFQLQSPTMLLIISLILFLSALNMLGIFHFTLNYKTSGTKDRSLLSSFLTGLLTTVVAAPCSAPFLATALATTLTLPLYTFFQVYLMIGLGLAFPFIILLMAPSAMHFFPRPGRWMDQIKRLLSIPLFLSTFYFLYVYQTMTSTKALIAVLVIFLFLIIIFIKKSLIKINSLKTITVFIFILALTIIISRVLGEKSEDVVWKRWDTKNVETLERPAFINFTAKWCLTCQANKVIILNRDSFKDWATQNGVTLYEVDWTNGDKAITDFLSKFGTPQVPLYLYITKDGEMKNLGATTSVKELSTF